MKQIQVSTALQKGTPKVLAYRKENIYFLNAHPGPHPEKAATCVEEKTEPFLVKMINSWLQLFSQQCFLKRGFILQKNI